MTIYGADVVAIVALFISAWNGNLLLAALAILILAASHGK